MMADFIIAADTAKFGQPEIKLGVTPGMGGSQRLTWAVGKAKAMEMCLTGRMMDAAEAERSGLVAKVVPAASCSTKRSRPPRRSPPCRRSPRSRSRKWSMPRSRSRSARASGSSGGCSTACSGPRTRRKAWPRSSRSGRAIGREVDCPGEGRGRRRIAPFLRTGPRLRRVRGVGWQDRIHRARAYGRRDGAQPRQGRA